jgi:hypothetical protein
VQAEEFHDSIRPGLIAMLPRLKRFADLLVGGREDGTALLRRALQMMLAEEHRYQRGTALDRWAFAEIYDHGKPLDVFTTSFLRSLPPPQRLTLLLVYAERFDHIDAGRVLDVSAETIGARLVRISASLADRLSEREPRPPSAVGTHYADAAS